MKPSAPRRTAAPPPKLPGIFAVLLGAFLGLTLMKFGNPPIFEKNVVPPSNIFEFFLGYPWPVSWSYGLLGLLAVLAWRLAQWRVTAPRWLVVLPLLWCLWQVPAAVHSLDPEMSRFTVAHLATCTLCFYLGLFGLGRVGNWSGLFVGLILGFLVVLVVGWEQHFGGLQQSRQYFFTYVYPGLKDPSPELVKKMSSTRIFSTLFYPNTLAGVVLLLLPPIIAVLERSRRMFSDGARWFLMSAITVGALACLYWSGSKGGWLLMLFLVLLALWRLPLSHRARAGLLAVLVVLGLASFIWKHSGYVQKGATSVTARFDYWSAAVRTAIAHPVFGTGPGAFSKSYSRIKRPESEMTRLVHNDYLEQACDAGWPAFLCYSLFIAAALWHTRPHSCGPSARLSAATEREPDWLAFAIWLGLLGWSLQSLMEFGLYIPALAWPAFTFLGGLLGRNSDTAQGLTQTRIS